MARYRLFGDSYIKRLYRFCNGDLHVPGSSKFVYRDGLGCDRLDEAMKKKMKAAKTDFIFLSTGGNNIRAPSPTQKTSSTTSATWRKSSKTSEYAGFTSLKSYPDPTSPKVSHPSLLSQNLTGTEKG